MSKRFNRPEDVQRGASFPVERSFAMPGKRMVGALLITCLLWPQWRATHNAEAASGARVTIFAGLQGGAVYRSTDDGAQWAEADGGLPVDVDVTALALGSATGSPIYAGTAQSGVYISEDGGNTWQDDNGDENLLSDADVTSLAVAPSDPTLVYAATTDNVMVSADSGQTWSILVNPPSDRQITSLALSPRQSSTLLIGTSQGVIRMVKGLPSPLPATASLDVRDIAFGPKTGLVAYAATASGIYQTIDGGKTWQADRRGLDDESNFTTVAVSPSQAGIVVAATQDGSLFRTLDGGTTWQRVDLDGNVTGTSVTSLLFDPAAGQTILAGGSNAMLFRSIDDGVNWYDDYGNIPGYSTILCLAAVSKPRLPTDPVNPPTAPLKGATYVKATGHYIRAPFLDFYNKNMGLKIFGLPLTEVMPYEGHFVQFFERAELEITANGIVEAPLGSILTQGRAFPTVHAFAPSPTKMYFSATKHSLSGNFLKFWQNHHGAQLFGLPISEPLREKNGDGTGRVYLVQYFQNARLEFHPELAGTNNEVMLGLLGRQYLQQLGWL
jgi:photosystem II stability/assembly factor-like uncharacterized protein